MTAEKAFNSWVTSSSHHAVILNRNQWEKASWGAIGISIYKEYATVWFGKSADEEGEPDHCE